MADNPLQPNIRELVGGLADQTSRLVRDEIELVQAQAKEAGQKYGIGAGLFAGAAFLGVFAFATLIATAVLGLANAVPAWLAALIVALVLLAIAGALALIGKKQIEKAGPAIPDVKQNLGEDVDAIKTGLKDGLHP